MATKKLTQKEIAQALDLSPTAVSVTLSDPQTTRVSEERKQAILDYVREHVPRLYPKINNQRVVLCLPEINAYSGSVYGGITSGVKEACRKREWDMEIQMGQLPDNRQLLRTGDKPTGIIAVVGRDSFDHLEHISKELPVVLVNSQESPQFCDEVDLDNRAGIELLMKALYSQGHRRFVFVRDHNGKDRFRHHLRQRTEAFFGFAIARGLEVSSGDCVNVGDFGPPGQAPSYDAMLSKVLSRKNPPTGFVCFNDMVASQVIHAAHRADVAVPEKFSVTGYDDHDMAMQTSPQITTVRHDRSEMGKIAVDVLSQRIHQPKSPFSQLLISPKLVSRQSIGRI